MNRGLRAALLFSVAAGVAFGCFWLLNNKPADTTADPPALEHLPRVDLGQLPLSVSLNKELELIGSRVLPGVVSIQVDRRGPAPAPLRPNTKTVPANDAAEEEPSVAAGTIVRKDGLVLTNWHVVAGAGDSILVTLHGEENVRRAKIVDHDESRDLALLRIEPVKPGEEFTALRFGDSSKVRVCHMVLAMGSPWGLRDTVTFGIISHVARVVGDTYTAFLQTSCVINPGNSGGPLVNLQGDVVGIITRKLLGPDEKASAEGYGLAIPSNEARIVIDNLERKGPQPYAGLTVEDWPERYWLKQEDPEGVIVRGVSQRSPSEAAGLRAGDIIESVDGERVPGTAAFWRAVRARGAGDSMKVSVRRGGEAVQFFIVLTTLPEPAKTVAVVRGVTLRKLHSFERSLLGVIESTGLRVERVDPASPLAGILRERMNILHAGGSGEGELLEVATLEEFEKMLTEYSATGGVIVTASFGGPLKPISFPPIP